MRIAVFTSNQPRHIALIEALCGIAEEVYAVQECNTLFPGEVQDFFGKSPVMQEYFSRVMAAERRVFGGARFLPRHARSLPVKMGDLSRVPIAALEPAIEADIHVVFGASFIRGRLCQELVARGAYNIHMGTSPYYRGSSTNFWAMYDGRADHVGATIHRLTSGLDSGPMLFHAFPPTCEMEPFEVGMRAVQAAHRGLAEAIADGRLGGMQPVAQDKGMQLRYTRNADFTDQVAEEYLGRLPTPGQVAQALAGRDLARFVAPWVMAG